MAANKSIEEMDDREFEELLKILRPVEARDPETVLSGRANYITELDFLIENTSQFGLGWLAGLTSTIRNAKEIFTMNNSTPRFVFSALAAIVVILVLLFSSASATVYAAQSALPGDTLYSIKTGLEQTQVNLSRDAANRAQLHLDFAGRRLNETAALIEEGRFNDIGAATVELEYHIQQAIGELQTVALGDPARAETLAADIAVALSRYASTLSGMLSQVPESVRPDVERAIQFSQMESTDSGMDDSQEEIEFSGTVEEISPISWVVDGQLIIVETATVINGVIQVGDIVKVHAWQNPDGSLTAREIELTDDPLVGNENDNENDNEDDGNVNDNDNDDDNGNVNDNDDDDDNGNLNDNDNDNDDDDDNGNANHNDSDDDDDDGNNNNDDDDDDDDGNDNDNDNDDDDDDDDDDNDNDNDNEDDDDNNHNDDDDDDDDDD